MKDRGTRAWSLSEINTQTLQLHTSLVFAESFSRKKVEKYEGREGFYYLLHLQSPTASQYRTHPARETVDGQNHYLWHNGMIEGLAREWDTQILLHDYVLQGRLNDFNGSFACYYLKEGEEMVTFRNAISPQFYNKDNRTFCSSLFPGAKETPKNSIIDMLTGDAIGTFNNEYDPFGIGG